MVRVIFHFFTILFILYITYLFHNISPHSRLDKSCITMKCKFATFYDKNFQLMYHQIIRIFVSKLTPVSPFVCLYVQ